MLVTIFRTVILYIAVVLCMRIMGKRQVGELQPAELVVTILISELASIPVQDLSRPVISGIVPVVVLVVLEILMSSLTLKIPPLRRAVSGKPAIVIRNGQIDQKMMKKLRMTIDDLMEGLRQAGTFKIQQVAYAVMETNGKISVMLFDDQTPPTKQELHMPAPCKGMPVTVISDGRLQKQAFASGQITKEQVMARLHTAHLTVDQVFLMTANLKNEFFIVKKKED